MTPGALFALHGLHGRQIAGDALSSRVLKKVVAPRWPQFRHPPFDRAHEGIESPGAVELDEHLRLALDGIAQLLVERGERNPVDDREQHRHRRPENGGVPREKPETRAA